MNKRLTVSTLISESQLGTRGLNLFPVSEVTTLDNSGILSLGRCAIMKTQDAIVKFLIHCRIANYSPKTIAEYRYKLLPFARLLPRLPTNPEPIEQFLITRNVGAITKHGDYCALRSFYHFLNTRYGVRNPMLKIIRPRKPKRVLPSLTLEQLKSLFNVATSLREKALISLLMDNGLRVGELLSLHKEDLQDGVITVRGKMGERQVPISPLAMQLLKKLESDNGFFVGQRGRLRRGGIYRIIRKLMGKADITGNKLGPHRLRHGFAKNYLLAGGDVCSLQKILGHANIKTTEQYIDLTMGDVLKQHHRFSPLQFMEDRK